MIHERSLSTPARECLVEITDLLQQAVHEANIHQGSITVFIPHTTAAVTINENADPTVKRDMLTTLARLIPHHGNYHHSEGNSDAHVKASMFGASERILVHNGKLLLGTWQGIYFCEFDGPRSRRMYLHLEGNEQDD